MITIHALLVALVACIVEAPFYMVGVSAWVPTPNLNKGLSPCHPLSLYRHFSTRSYCPSRLPTGKSLRMSSLDPAASLQPSTTSTTSTNSATTPPSVQSDSSRALNGQNGPYRHILVILVMPETTLDRIANEAILDTAMAACVPGAKLSIVLKCQGGTPPSLAQLRKYVGEVYSQVWDCCSAAESDRLAPLLLSLPDVVVYPSNLPNTAPESWIHIQPDLEAVCSHDALTGWKSESALGRGRFFDQSAGNGRGGLQEHVQAMNSERQRRNMAPVVAITPQQWPTMASATAQEQAYVHFMDDDDDDDHVQNDVNHHLIDLDEKAYNELSGGEEEDESAKEETTLLAGPRIPANRLFESVAVGGTFDGLHFGHRKLLTLAVSSVNPLTGRLLVGVTVDEMLQHKAYAAFIPSWQERCDGVRDFLHRLAPGMMNRVKIVPIADAYGPPGRPDLHFDALVLSHETLSTGLQLNRHRVEQLKLPALHLLCIQRTEAHGMSSTALRKLRKQQSDMSSSRSQQ